MFGIKYKLLDWIDYTKLDKFELSINPNAVEFLSKNQHMIDWSGLSANTNDGAIELLKANYTIGTNNTINWKLLSSNTNSGAISILRTNIEHIDWYNLSNNTSSDAIKLLQEYPNKIHWFVLSSNTNDGAIELLKNNPDKINWYLLSGNNNDGAIQLLKENLYKINWKMLSTNTNDGAIELLSVKDNMHLIDWDRLSMNSNPRAIKLLLQNKHNINWIGLAANSNDIIVDMMEKENKYINMRKLVQNKNSKAGEIYIKLLSLKTNYYDYIGFAKHPNIFIIDTDAMHKQCESFKEELLSVVFHPSRMTSFAMFIEKYGIDNFQSDKLFEWCNN